MALSQKRRREHEDASEVRLRIERSQIGGRIDRASRKVEGLRGDGHREGSRELEGALAEVRRLQDRQDRLPDLICDAISARCRSEAERLGRESRELGVEHERLRTEARSAWSKARVARREAEETTARLEGVENRRDELRRRAAPYEHFAQKADEFEGRPQKRARLLADAQAEGLLLPIGPIPPEDPSENGGEDHDERG